MLNRIFHVAINARDLDKSLAFYRTLGFTVLSDREVDNDMVKTAFNVPTGTFRFAHLRLGDAADATVLDIVEWYDPATAPGPAAAVDQHSAGLTRFAVLTDDTDEVYRTLSEAGYDFLTTPSSVLTAEGGWRVCLIQDPDGVTVQVTQLLPPPSA